MRTAVAAENLSKIYTGEKKAVNHISFTLNEGEIFGFLGPNGAGKTTTIKLLCGMLAPSGGSCRVFDINPSTEPEKLHQLSGVVTEHAQMYQHLSGMENLIFYGTLFGMSRSACEKRAGELLEQLDLSKAQHQKLSAYSTGMRQRLSLARAMMHSPKILFLDEPTSGLDPESAQNVNQLIQKLATDGTTVFLCTHQLRYAQEICTTYGLMEQGNLFAMGTLEKLRSMAFCKMQVEVKTTHMPKDLNYEKTGAHTYTVSVHSEEEIPMIARKIMEAGGSIYQIIPKQRSLEDIYFALIDKNEEKTREERL